MGQHHVLPCKVRGSWSTRGLQPMPLAFKTDLNRAEYPKSHPRTSTVRPEMFVLLPLLTSHIFSFLPLMFVEAKENKAKDVFVCTADPTL